MDEQPSDQPPPPRPRPQAAPRRRPPSRAELRSAEKAAAPPRRSRPAPERRRPAAPVATADEVDDGDGAPPPPTDARQKRMVVLLSIATVVVIGLVFFAISRTASSTGDDIPPPAPADTPVPVTKFEDPETGFSVEYPRGWERVQLPVADYRLAVDAGDNVAFTIRVLPIQTPATTANLVNFKAVTDGLVASNSTVKVLKEQAVTLNGMLGYYYFYTFTDGAVEAVHAHYFLFSGNKMNIIVFQTLPDDFERLAPTFDRIAESFRSDPSVRVAAPPAPSSTATSQP